MGLLVAAATVSLVTGGPVWRGVAAGELANHGDAGGCRRRRDHGHPAASGSEAAERRSDVAVERHLLERGWTPMWKRAYLDLIFIALGLGILGINRADRRAVADPDRRHVPGAVVLCAAGTDLPLARGHLPGGPGRAGDLESTGGAGAVEAVAFVARSCHPMDGPASGPHGRRSHARSVGGGIRHPGIGVRGDLSHREND